MVGSIRSSTVVKETLTGGLIVSLVGCTTAASASVEVLALLLSLWAASSCVRQVRTVSLELSPPSVAGQSSDANAHLQAIDAHLAEESARFAEARRQWVLLNKTVAVSSTAPVVCSRAPCSAS